MMNDTYSVRKLTHIHQILMTSGEIFGLMTLSIGTGIIGFSQIGLMAAWIGVRPALFTSATLGLVSLLLVCRRWPQILESQPG